MQALKISRVKIRPIADIWVDWFSAAQTTTSSTRKTLAVRWEDVTSANSLAHVAKLHCNIESDKSIREDFLTAQPSDILRNIDDYISYCAHDVSMTHAVFRRVFPLFRRACPSPVTLAGIMTMGNSFLPVNESWEDYLRHAEAKFRELEEAVKSRLRELAEGAKTLMVDGSWSRDPWLAQLDWSPKVPRKAVTKSEAAGSSSVQGLYYRFRVSAN